MEAPNWDPGISPQHQFSKKGWSQHLDSALKVCDITIPKLSPWPTDYNPI